ncbi:MAG: FtsK/SpoIIIE family DNA translocase [Anaerolineae bacterium]
MTAKQPARKRHSSKPTRAAGTPIDWRQCLLQREVWGLALTTIGAVTVASLLIPNQGRLSSAWALTLRQMFGVGSYPVALFCFLSGAAILLWQYIEDHVHPRWQSVVGAEVLFFGSLGLIHMVTPGLPLELATAGQAGGFIGWGWWQLLVPLLGKAVSTVLLALLALWGVYLVLGIPWALIVWRARWLWAQVGVRLRPFVQATAPAMPPVRPQGSVQAPPIPTLTRAIPRPPMDEPDSSVPLALPKERRPRKPVERPLALPRLRPATGPTDLPSLDLLVADEGNVADEAETRMRAQIIKDTLGAFGIPAEVTESHRGPTVTQFGVEPGYVEKQDRDGNMVRYKIRVNKILALTNDLALALAAAPIRIEAPVPGRNVVGIEVPNGNKTVVGLRGVLESKTFERMRAPLRIALGRDVSGEAVVASLASMPHLLLAGATGTGKSVCLNAIVASLLFHYPPEQLRMVMIDPKRVELVNYDRIPHLEGRVVVDPEKATLALRWVTKEMDRRYAQLAQVGVRNIVAYNKVAKAKGLDELPYIVVVIDELADLMLAAPDDVERTLCRIAQLARATGIHLVVATQRPSVDVVTGLIKANFPARISFAVTSQIDSRVILDAPGAEKLLGRGDMLYMAPDSAKLQRIQGCWVSDPELERLVTFWRHQPGSEEQAGGQAAPWDGMSPEEDASDDKLLEEAAELVRQHNQASASFLQRQMRIGYPRAARLMDQLESMGVVGPPEAGGRTRIVQTESEEQQAEALLEDEPPSDAP